MAMSLIDFLRELLSDAGLRQQFTDDPQGTLAANGLGNLSADDLHDALTLMCDSQEQDSGGHHSDGGHVATPHAPAHDQSPIEYLRTYITNNYSIDDRDTTIDNSIHQNIDNRDGTFDQDIDNSNVIGSGDGAVVAGDDIDGTVTTGAGNQVGTGNVSGHGNVVGTGNQAVTGDDATTSFGAGSASSVHGGVTVGPGGAFSDTGEATTDNIDNSVDGSFNDQSHTQVEDSFNDQSDSSTHTDSSSHDSYEDDHHVGSHTESATSHSFDHSA